MYYSILIKRVTFVFHLTIISYGFVFFFLFLLTFSFGIFPVLLTSI